jgi:hypothetical protein
VQVIVIMTQPPSFNTRYFVPISTWPISVVIDLEADRVGVLAVVPGPGGAGAPRWYFCDR